MSTCAGTTNTRSWGTAVHDVAAGRRTDDDGFAMMTVILLIMICAALSVLMLGVVVAQVKPTVFEAKNNRTISAAETGADATLSQLRTATTMVSGVPYGDPRKLPCTVAGTMGQAGTTLSYAVTIRYFNANPAGKSDFWRNANALGCIVGSGVATPPSFALIRSTGSDAAVAGYAATVGDRTVESVYTFKVTNVNVAGGIMWNWGRLNCLKVDDASPHVGSTISYDIAANCIDDQVHLWSYKTDYTIRLASTDFSGSSSILCLAGPAVGAASNRATLQTCDPTKYNQRWAWHDGARFFVVDANGQKDETNMMSVGSTITTGLTGMPLVVNHWSGYNSPSASFDPDPRVGAGHASSATKQVVSYLEFGRCFDVTNGDVKFSLMILYPCKQAPGTADSLDWNHQWWFDEPLNNKGAHAAQPIKVINTGTNYPGTYCLTAPASTAAPAYVTLKGCTGANNQSWIRNAQMDTYGVSWTITDTTGVWCVSVGPKAPADPLRADITAYSTMVYAKCSGGSEQKWNAPALNMSASLDNVKELN